MASLFPKRTTVNPATAAEIATTKRNVAYAYKALEYGSYGIGGISLLKGIVVKGSKSLMSGSFNKQRRNVIKGIGVVGAGVALMPTLMKAGKLVKDKLYPPRTYISEHGLIKMTKPHTFKEVHKIKPWTTALTALGKKTKAAMRDAVGPEKLKLWRLYKNQGKKIDFKKLHTEVQENIKRKWHTQ